MSTNLVSHASESPSCERVEGLFAAIRDNDIRRVGALLDGGADLRALDSRGHSALRLAVNLRRTAIVRILLARGADVNQRDANSGTALIAASARGYPGLARLLLSTGADPDVVDEDGGTPLVHAGVANYHRSWRTVVRLLREHGAHVGMPEAGLIGDIGVMADLLRRGHSIDQRGWQGRTALFLAVLADRDRAARWLLRHGADPNVPDEQGERVLMLTATRYRRDGRWDPSLLKSMLAAGAEVNARDQRGFTALMFAAFRGDKTAVEVLLEHPADPNATAEREILGISFGWAAGWAPLHWAAGEGQCHIVAPLVAAGAHVDQTDAWGRTPLMLAAGTGDHEYTLTVSELLAREASVNIVDDTGRTALMWAADENNPKSAQLLLDAGADPTLIDAEGETALDIAQRKEYESVVALLRRRGAQSS
jgi:ankyrin repeat protein